MADVSKPVRAEKTCVECNKKFIPTGNCQKRCQECAKNKPKKAAQVRVTAKSSIIEPRPNVCRDAHGQTSFPLFLRNLQQSGVTIIVFGDIKITIDKI